MSSRLIEGKRVISSMESLDVLYARLVENEKVTSLKWSHQEIYL
jgi:hypothetical protein